MNQANFKSQDMEQEVVLQQATTTYRKHGAAKQRSAGG